jgi:hypothetical protein
VGVPASIALLRESFTASTFLWTHLCPQIVHVYGTSYQMGVQYGALLNKEINSLVPQFYQYVYGQMGTCVWPWW